MPFPPEEVSRVRSYIEQHRTSQELLDLVISHTLPLNDPAAAAEEARRYEQVGVTWIVRDWLPWDTGPDEVRAQLRRGPLGSA